MDIKEFIQNKATKMQYKRWVGVNGTKTLQKKLRVDGYELVCVRVYKNDSGETIKTAEFILS